jgi:hypothetical protein
MRFIKFFPSIKNKKIPDVAGLFAEPSWLFKNGY